MGQYLNLAEIYDSMIDMDYDGWINFVAEYCSRNNITLRGKKALELGCGTGNMTMRLKNLGMEITALDISDDMLFAAQEKALNKRYRITFLNQDMVDFEIKKSFDFVFSFCDGYNYIIEEERLKKGFKNVFDHINSEGCFIFDISTAHKLKNVVGSNTFTQNKEDLCYIWDNYFENKLLEMYISFFIREGNMYRRIDENHIQRAYDENTVIGCLRDAGFSKIEVYNDYSFDKVDDNSLRATFIAKK
jgi:ubiquinone/menaquinone biosynthesis C-methylase UbiE